MNTAQGPQTADTEYRELFQMPGASRAAGFRKLPDSILSAHHTIGGHYLAVAMLVDSTEYRRFYRR
jgi:hypothetical protein